MLIELVIAGSGSALWSNSKRKKSKQLISIIQKAAEKEKQQPVFDVKKLAYDFKSAIVGNERQKLQLSLNPNMQLQIESRKKEENRKLVLAADATGLAFLGRTSPAFYVLGSFAVVYLGRHVLNSVYRDFRHWFSLTNLYHIVY